MLDSSKTADRTYEAILEALHHLIEVVATLRSPLGGCPWDLVQTPETLIPYVIEEAYERGHFSLQEIAQGITEKLIRRHPHVFGDLTVSDPDEVQQNWEKLKAEEKGETTEQTQQLTHKLKRYARSLPPLMAGMKISQKAASVGFEWNHVDGVWDKFSEELAEFKQALESEDKDHQEAELGDLLFVIINLARWYGLDPTQALQETNHRFIKRLSLVEQLVDGPLSDYSLDELETMWQQAKANLREQEEYNKKT
jgi:XTP/dITP diphosphohydrolase